MKLFLLISLALASVNAFAYDASLLKDMPFVTTAKYCLECHTKAEALVYKNKVTKSCSVYCQTCHDDLEAHHIVDRFLIGKKSEQIDLHKNKIACFTCHDLTQKRFDNTSWKSESLFESMFQSQDVYRTYFLIEQNNKGQLCKKCH
jgi:Cytochrome c554 and c-prime